MSRRKPISPTSSTGSSISGPQRASTNLCRGHGSKPTPPIDWLPDARPLKLSRQLHSAVGRKGRLHFTHIDALLIVMRDASAVGLRVSGARAPDADRMGERA